MEIFPFLGKNSISFYSINTIVEVTHTSQGFALFVASYSSYRNVGQSRELLVFRSFFHGKKRTKKTELLFVVCSFCPAKKNQKSGKAKQGGKAVHFLSVI